MDWARARRGILRYGLVLFVPFAGCEGESVTLPLASGDESASGSGGSGRSGSSAGGATAGNGNGGSIATGGVSPTGGRATAGQPAGGATGDGGVAGEPGVGGESGGGMGGIWEGECVDFDSPTAAEPPNPIVDPDSRIARCECDGPYIHCYVPYEQVCPVADAFGCPPTLDRVRRNYAAICGVEDGEVAYMECAGGITRLGWPDATMIFSRAGTLLYGSFLGPPAECDEVHRDRDPSYSTQVPGTESINFDAVRCSRSCSIGRNVAPEDRCVLDSYGRLSLPDPSDGAGGQGGEAGFGASDR